MSKAPTSADVMVGIRLKMRRNELGMSQQALGEKLGLTFQQIQKYENGANRIGAGRLSEMAKILDVPVGYFFPEDHGAKSADRGARALDLLSEPGMMDFLQTFADIADPALRKAVRDLARALARHSVATSALVLTTEPIGAGPGSRSRRRRSSRPPLM